MANKIVQLQNKDGDNIFPVSAGLASDSVTTDMIQDGAVTDEKIDFSTLKPRWKVVSTSNTNTVTIPTGYRMYRLTFVGYKATTDWGVFNSSYKTGTGWAYGCGFRNGNWFSEEFTSDNNSTFITCGAGTSIASGEQLTTMTMSVNGTSVQCVYQNSYWNSGSYNSGRSCFNITSGSSDWTISSECSTNKWVVEAFDE